MTATTSECPSVDLAAAADQAAAADGQPRQQRTVELRQRVEAAAGWPGPFTADDPGLITGTVLLTWQCR
jgi:hypothetical protein